MGVRPRVKLERSVKAPRAFVHKVAKFRVGVYDTRRGATSAESPRDDVQVKAGAAPSVIDYRGCWGEVFSTAKEFRVPGGTVQRAWSVERGCY